MRYSTAQMGRIFVIRLGDGEVLHETIERFAEEQGIGAAALIIVGGADEGSKLVVGPEKGRDVPVNPMTQILNGVHEITGTGRSSRMRKGNRCCTCISPPVGRRPR